MKNIYKKIHNEIKSLLKPTKINRMNNNMYLFGSAIFAGKYPRFCPDIDNLQISRLFPRPY